MKFRLGKNKVLVERKEAPETTESGLLKIPDVLREKPDFGFVIAVGSEVTDWKVGDFVFYPKYSGFVVNLPNEKRDTIILFSDEIWLAQEAIL